MTIKFIYPLIADANQNLSNFQLAEIISPVEKFFSEHFQINWRINVVITTSLPWLIIPEDGVGGKTYAGDFVILAVNQSNMTLTKCSEMLAHELAHAVRWGQNPEWSKNLFCELVSEGIAVHVEAEFMKNRAEKTFFLRTILGRSDKENHAMFKKLKSEFTTTQYNYDGIFFGNHQRPRWTGYSVGYYIVSQYLRKTGKSIFDVIAEPYDAFNTNYDHHK